MIIGIIILIIYMTHFHEKDQSSMTTHLILNILSHPARTAWALAAEAVWAAARRERRRRPRSWRRSARAMNIWTGGAKLELVTIDSWVLSLSVYSYCHQSGRGKYLGQLTLLALAFFQIRWSLFWKSNWSGQQRDARCTGKLWRRVSSSVWWWSESLGWASPPWYETSHFFHPDIFSHRHHNF